MRLILATALSFASACGASGNPAAQPLTPPGQNAGEEGGSGGAGAASDVHAPTPTAGARDDGTRSEAASDGLPPRDAHCPELPPPEGNALSTPTRSPPDFVVRGRVAEASTVRSRYDGQQRLYVVRVIEILEYLVGDGDRVRRPYRRRFPLYQEIRPNEGAPRRGPPRPGDLERGQEFILAVDLPTDHASTVPDDMPPQLRRRFGRFSVALVHVTPIERLAEVRATEEAAERARVAAVANDTGLAFVDGFSGYARPDGSANATARRASADAARDFVRTQLSNRLGATLAFEEPALEALAGQTPSTRFEYPFAARSEDVGELPSGRLRVLVRDASARIVSFSTVWTALSRWDTAAPFDPGLLSRLVERDLGLEITGGEVTRDVRDLGLGEIEVRIGGAVPGRPSQRPRFLRHVEVHVTPRCFAIVAVDSRY